MVVSAVDGGKATDCELVNQSGFLRFLKPGDKVLADKVKLFPMELNHSVHMVQGFSRQIKNSPKLYYFGLIKR